MTNKELKKIRNDAKEYLRVLAKLAHKEQKLVKAYQTGNYDYFIDNQPNSEVWWDDLAAARSEMTDDFNYIPNLKCYSLSSYSMAKSILKFCKNTK